MDDYLQQLFSEVQLLTPTAGAIFSIVLALLLLLVSGFASGSEIAFFSLSPSDLNDLDEDKNPVDGKIQRLRENFGAANVKISAEEIAAIDARLDTMEFDVFGGHAAKQ